MLAPIQERLDLPRLARVLPVTALILAACDQRSATPPVPVATFDAAPNDSQRLEASAPSSDAGASDAADLESVVPPRKLIEDDREAIARVLCEGSEPKREDTAWTCTCPAHTEFGGEGSLSVEMFHPGSYTATRRDEVVVKLGAGCESNATTAQTHGTHALLRRTRAGWKRLLYEPNALGQCTPIASIDHRLRLVCHVASGHHGFYADEFIVREFVDVEGAVSEKAGSFLRFDTEAPGVSTPGSDGKLNVIAIRRFEIKGRERYAAGDEMALKLDIDLEARTVCAKASACRGPESIKLRYAFDGANMQLLPESQKALDRLSRREAQH